MLDCFISGFKQEVRRDVIAQAPTTLILSVSLAKLYEEKYTTKLRVFHPNPWPKTQTTSNSLPSSHTKSVKSTSLPSFLPSPKPPFTMTNPKLPNVKRMTTTKMLLRREKGLCYTCDDKFTPTHRCPNKQYLILHMEENAPVDLQPDPPNSNANIVLQDCQDHHLSYNALKGSFGLGTMKFQGSINGMQVQILLDNGSSNNFLQPRLSHYLKLPVEIVPTLPILVGNGSPLMAEGLVKDLEVKIQGHSLKLPIYLLQISRDDLVLGAAWLAIVGPHISNYSNLTLKFYLNNQSITLHGERSQLPSPAHFTHLRRMHNTHCSRIIYTPNH